jgi:hypothetical protein
MTSFGNFFLRHGPPNAPGVASVFPDEWCILWDGLVTAYVN